LCADFQGLRVVHGGRLRRRQARPSNGGDSSGIKAGVWGGNKRYLWHLDERTGQEPLDAPAIIQ
jgi:hypothetical protein